MVNPAGFNVVVREADNGQVTVGFMDLIAVLKLTHNPQIAHDRQGCARLERVQTLLKG